MSDLDVAALRQGFDEWIKEFTSTWSGAIPLTNRERVLAQEAWAQAKCDAYERVAKLEGAGRKLIHILRVLECEPQEVDEFRAALDEEGRT